MAHKKQIILPIAILVVGVIAYFGFASLKTPPEEKAEVENIPIVAVENIVVAPITLQVSSYGIVKPKYETSLVAQVNGEIVELNNIFVRGGFVKKGQLLARIDPNDYHAALIDAQANMASARAALEKEVAQGKVAEREWKHITDTSPTKLSLRKPQLAQELARVKSAQATVLRAQRNLQRTEITAPYDAMIDSRLIGLGSFVSVGSQIGKLLGTAIAEVRLPVADNQLQFLINQGHHAKVKLVGSYAGKSIEWMANIVRNEGVIDDKSRMTYLVAEIKNPYLLSGQLAEQNDAANAIVSNTTVSNTGVGNNVPLRFGSYVKAEILGVEIANASILPRYLVVGNEVALLDNDSKLHYAIINIVRQQGADVVVSSGLLEGDRLIISALDSPINGMKLTLISDKKDQQDPLDKNTKVQVASTENEGE
ncbi:MAG: efflux RND transporter periplasmic adaptor subunit [Colwellia sp.]|nr:efflux RND transporter periplasmic adaptor subunit [Colwellia sp.]